jgi:hypothetical protein
MRFHPFRPGIAAYGPFCLLAGLLLLPASAAGQRLSDSALLSRGMSAFDSLPPSVTSADATVFANAVRYLFAYEQRNPPRMRADSALACRIRANLVWLSSNLERTSPPGTLGAAPPPRRILADEELRSRGLERYDDLPNAHPVSGRDAIPFIQALANLYALEQRSGPAIDARVHTALEWLEANLSQINRSGTSGRVVADGAGPAARPHTAELRDTGRGDAADPERAAPAAAAPVAEAPVAEAPVAGTPAAQAPAWAPSGPKPASLHDPGSARRSSVILPRAPRPLPQARPW